MCWRGRGNAGSPEGDAAHTNLRDMTVCSTSASEHLNDACSTRTQLQLYTGHEGGYLQLVADEWTVCVYVTGFDAVALKREPMFNTETEKSACSTIVRCIV